MEKQISKTNQGTARLKSISDSIQDIVFFCESLIYLHSGS